MFLVFILILKAEAYAIEVKAKAEAEQMAKKADAWKEYQEAALVDMMLKVGSSFYNIYLIVLYISSQGVACCRCRGEHSAGQVQEDPDGLRWGRSGWGEQGGDGVCHGDEDNDGLRWVKQSKARELTFSMI